MTLSSFSNVSITRHLQLRTRFVQVFSMLFFNKGFNICNILCRLPSTVDQTISQPIHQIMLIVANNLGIKNNNNFILQSTFKFDREWRWSTIWNKTYLTWFEERTMKYWMYSLLWRKIKVKSNIINFSVNMERAQSSIIQFFARSSSFDVPS